MHRSNPIAYAGGLLFLGALGVVFAWTHEIPRKLQLLTTEAWLLGATVAGFFLWIHGTRLRALVNGVPTSRLATAPQGYVELVGRAVSAEKVLPGSPSLILWKRTQFARRAAGVFPFNLAHVVHSVDITDAPFGFEDGSGQAIVIPAGAEIICARREVEYREDGKIIRERIQAGDSLYVLGDLATSRPDLDLAALTERRLHDWKMDAAQSRRFDADGDGHLDGRELLAMHKAARESVMQESAAEAASGINVLSRGDGRRRFLISSVPVDRLAGHYRWHLGVGLAMFVAGLAVLVSFHRAFVAPA